eukprot:42565-Amphidinium_carterae.1
MKRRRSPLNCLAHADTWSVGYSGWRMDHRRAVTSKDVDELCRLWCSSSECALDLPEVTAVEAWMCATKLQDACKRAPSLARPCQGFVAQVTRSPSRIYKGICGTAAEDIAIQHQDGYDPTLELNAWSKLWQPGRFDFVVQVRMSRVGPPTIRNKSSFARCSISNSANLLNKSFSLSSETNHAKCGVLTRTPPAIPNMYVHMAREVSATYPTTVTWALSSSY